jgi:hypothetical protein
VCSPIGERYGDFAGADGSAQVLERGVSTNGWGRRALRGGIEVLIWRRWPADHVGDGVRERRRGRASWSPAEASVREEAMMAANAPGVMTYSYR